MPFSACAWTACGGTRVAGGSQAAVRHGFRVHGKRRLYAVYHEADLPALSARLSWRRPFGTEAEIVEGDRLEQLEPQMRQARAAVYCPEESHVYAPDYVRALEAACRATGVQIRECGS